MNIVDEVSNIVKKLIDNQEIFLVEVAIKGKVGNQKIQVFIDGDHGVDIEECSKISRNLSELIEERDLIEGKHLIEVSSPGVDRPLKFSRQYPKHIGRELEIVTRDMKKYQGILLGVLNNEIEVSVKSNKVKKELGNATLKLPFAEIDKAKVVIRF